MGQSGANGEAEIIDPQIDFRINALTRFVFEPEKAWWIVQIDLGSKSLQQMLDEEVDLRPSVTFPGIYDGDVLATEGRFFFTIFAQRPFIDAANRKGNRFGVVRMLVGSIIPGFDPTVSLDFQKTRSEVPGGSVIMGVVDNGLAFAHGAFRKSKTETRVEFAWVFDAAVALGREFNRSEIDWLLGRHGAAKMLNEDAFYLGIGLLDYSKNDFGHKPAGFRTSHGTHVMGLAAGYALDEPERLKRPIICVDLPTYATADTSGNSIMAHVLLAIDYILIRSQSIIDEASNAVPPIVVNFSFGKYAGPHDGNGDIEEWLDAMFPEDGPNRIVMPAGNANLSRTHAEVRFTSTQRARSLRFRVQPEDKSASFVEIWLPKDLNKEQRLEVELEAPDGRKSGKVTNTTGSVAKIEVPDGSGNMIALAQVAFVKKKNRGLISIGIAPTVHETAPFPAVPGEWIITMKVGTGWDFDHDILRLWIERDETLPGFPAFGRQAYFDRPDGGGMPTTDLDASSTLARQGGTLSGYACGKSQGCVVVGGYVQSDRSIADYSGAGPTEGRMGPDVSAPSDTSHALRGQFSAGSRCGTIVAMSGTSVATPRVARWIADNLEAGDKGDREAVQQQAGIDDPYHDPKDEPRLGKGRMKLDVPSFVTARRLDH